MDNHDVLVRLNKVGGQVKGVKKLIEKNTELKDILIQIQAIKSALNSVSKLLIEKNMKSLEIDSNEDFVKELITTIEKALK